MASPRPPLGRPFAVVFTASTLSNVGDGVLLAALPLLARSLTSSPLAVSAVSAAATAPWLLFGLVAGAIVDRGDRLRLMVRADVARTLLLLGLAALAAAGRLHLVVLIAAVFAVGLAETLFDTAAQALLPRLVAGDQLERANGRLFGAQTVANGFVGPPLGAVLFSLRAAAPLILDACSFAVSALLLRTLPSTTTTVTTRSRAARPPRRDLVAEVAAEVREGLRWLWQHPVVRAYAVGAAVINLAHAGVLAVLVLYVRDELGVSGLGFGLVLAGAAAGGVAGSLAAARLVERLGRRAAVLWAVAAFALSLLVAGLASRPVVVAVGLAGFNAAGEVWNVVAVSYRQALVPDRLLGRVMASYRFIAYGALPLGAAAGGAVAAAYGLRAPFFVGAALVLGLLAHFVPASREPSAVVLGNSAHLGGRERHESDENP